MKIGTSTYSFLRLMKNGMTLEEVIVKASELGYEQIELGGLKPPDGMGFDEYAASLRQKCKDAGLEIGAYTVGADFLYGGVSKDPAAETARCKEDADSAAALGVDRMRIDVVPWAFQGPGTFRGVRDAIVPYIRDLTLYADSIGVKIMVENHGYFIQEGDRIVSLIDAVDHPNFGACVDIGNFLCADDDPLYAVRQLAGYAFHTHVKDFLWKDGQTRSPGAGWIPTLGGHYIRGTILGHGVVPIDQCIKILHGAKYDGGLSLEFEGPEESIPALIASQEYMSRALKELN